MQQAQSCRTSTTLCRGSALVLHSRTTSHVDGPFKAICFPCFTCYPHRPDNRLSWDQHEWLTYPAAVSACEDAGCEFEPHQGHRGLVALRLGASPLWEPNLATLKKGETFYVCTSDGLISASAEPPHIYDIHIRNLSSCSHRHPHPHPHAKVTDVMRMCNSKVTQVSSISREA